MRTLGYIVVGKKLTNIEGFVEQVHSIEEADSTKPILIVGWDNAKQFEGYNILDRKLSEGVFWTFSRAENRYEFEKDLKKFYNYLFDNVTKYIIYDYINIYISSNMMYAVLDDKILGVSFQMLEYCGISRDKVLKRIKENKSDGIIYDNSRDVIKLGRFLGNKKYAIPYFV